MVGSMVGVSKPTYKLGGAEDGKSRWWVVTGIERTEKKNKHES